MNALPRTVSRSIELMGLFVAILLVRQGSIVLMPLMMSGFFALMLMPIFRVCRKVRIPEVIAIFLPILLLTIVIIGISWLLSNRVGLLLNDLPHLQRNIARHLDHLSIWISRSFGFTPKDQLQLISEQSGKLFNALGGVIKTTLGSVTDAVIFLGLMPVYTYLVIYYRRIFVKFIMLWFVPERRLNVADGIKEIEKTVNRYLFGLGIQLIYITVLLGGGLAIIGIKNALLIGLVFAVLNLIPYLGALIGNILGILITLAASELLSDILIVLGAITVVQFLDNNILMPRIVGGQVRINALASIVGIVAGGVVAGIAGMFLAMPLLAILKVIFEHSTRYRQWSVLLSADRPKT